MNTESIWSEIAHVENVLNQRFTEAQLYKPEYPDFSLKRITKLMDYLGNPQDTYPIIHIAGTNGKTSTTRFIDSLLSNFSLRSGRTTSPHLQLVTERINIDSKPIDALTYCEIFEEVNPFALLVDEESKEIGEPILSKFEILTAMAYVAFAQAPVDVAVIEVGLGGRLDATNVACGKVAAITSLGLDHTEFLGDTLAKIAGEKAGIIKKLPESLIPEDQVVIIGKQEPEAMKVLLDKVSEVDAQVARYGQEFKILDRKVAVGGQQVTFQGLSGVFEDIFIPLHGSHQAQNAAVALACVESFFGAGKDRKLDIDNVRAGFAQASSPGRLERVAANPTVLIDAAHNREGALCLANAIKEDFSFNYIIAVIAVLSDKDARGIVLELNDVVDEFIITTSETERSLPIEDLNEIVTSISGEDRVTIAENLADAMGIGLDMVKDRTGSNIGSGGCMLVTGSVITVGIVRDFWGLESQ